MSSLYQVSSERHGRKQMVPLSSWKFAANLHIALLFPVEFLYAARHYPVVFIKQNDTILPFVLLGLQAGENLFVDDGYKWLVPYIPAVLRRYPFVMARVQGDKEDVYGLCIDESSGLLVDIGGAPLFTSDGKKSDYLEKCDRLAIECLQQEVSARAFCSLVVELDLFTPFPVEIEIAGKPQRVDGLLRIDENKLQALADSEFLKLRRDNSLALIYAHFSSLANVQFLQERVATRHRDNGNPDLPEMFVF